MTNSILSTVSKNDLSNFWKHAEEHAKDALTKIEFLKKFQTEYGLTIIQYPSSFPLAALHRVCNAIKQIKSLDNFNEIKFDAEENHTFVLSRNGSQSHINHEKKQAQTGGISSDDIIDFGDFRIVKIDQGFIEKGADFSLFKIRD